MANIPKFSGVAGAAWQLNWKTDKPHASVVQYLVRSKQFHPMWDRWIVGVVHLRDEPGITPAKKQFPAATHEFMIASVNPDFPHIDPDQSPPDRSKPLFLTPIDVVVQFEATDAEAISLVEESVRCIVRGLASPDQDYRNWWTSAIPNTLEHMRTGGQSCGKGPVLH